MDDCEEVSTSEEELDAEEVQEDSYVLDHEQTALLAEIAERLAHVDSKLATLLEKHAEPPPQDFYSTADLARLLGKAEWTCREWCRLGRVEAVKRPAGRGRHKEWMVSQEEVDRIRSEGLLPMPSPRSLTRRAR